MTTYAPVPMSAPYDPYKYDPYAGQTAGPGTPGYDPNNPFAAVPQGMNAAMGPTPYGYGTAPGQSSLGYYEQQTPAGSFAASQGAAPVQQQYGQAYTYSNPWIGQTSQGVGQQASVMPWGQQMAGYATGPNPWLGQGSAQAQQVGPNPYSGGNPYLQQQIDATTADATRAWQNAMNPQFDTAARASGSFGNTAIEQQRGQAMNDWGRNLSNTIGGMRMQDYTQQQQLAESALNRQQQMGQFNASLGANDLARNMQGFLSGQGLGLQGLQGALGAAQFDANLGNNVNQFNAGLGAADLSRNSQLAQALGLFNAGQMGGMSQFNAGQGNALGQFAAGQQQANNQFNATSGNQTIQNYLSRQHNQGQFDANMDFNAWNANNQNMRQGSIDQLNTLSTLLGLNQQYGVGNATTIQNTPLNYLQMFAGLGQGMGGMGGTASQNMQGNPWLGALGGWMAMQNMFRG